MTNPPGLLWRDTWTALSGPLSEVGYLPTPRRLSGSALAGARRARHDLVGADTPGGHPGGGAPSGQTRPSPPYGPAPARFTEREFFFDNLLVRIHFIIVMIRWTGLAPLEFEFPFSGSLTSICLARFTQWPTNHRCPSQNAHTTTIIPGTTPHLETNRRAHCYNTKGG